MTKYTVFHERWKCIGCGACVAVSPEHWELTADDGKSDLKKPTRKIKKPEGMQQEMDIDEIGTNKDAAEACPVECIKIRENK